MINLHMQLTFHPGTRLPKTSGSYLCIRGSTNTMAQLEFSKRHGKFNCTDYEETPKYACDVRWWAVLPKWMPWAGSAPRGEG